MRRIHLIIFLQLFICNNTGKLLRQRLIQVVVDPCVVISINRRNQQYQKCRYIPEITLRYLLRQFPDIREQRFVLRLLDHLVTAQDHGRQNRHTGDHSKYHALCHDHSDVKPQGKAHEA